MLVATTASTTFLPDRPTPSASALKMKPEELSVPMAYSKTPKVANNPIKENTGRWSREEHLLFLKGLQLHGKEWKMISKMISSRTVVQIRTHAQKYFQKVAKLQGNKGVAVSADMVSTASSSHSKNKRPPPAATAAVAAAAQRRGKRLKAATPAGAALAAAAAAAARRRNKKNNNNQLGAGGKQKKKRATKKRAKKKKKLTPSAAATAAATAAAAAEAARKEEEGGEDPLAAAAAAAVSRAAGVRPARHPGRKGSAANKAGEKQSQSAPSTPSGTRSRRKRVDSPDSDSLRFGTIVLGPPRRAAGDFHAVVGVGGGSPHSHDREDLLAVDIISVIDGSKSSASPSPEPNGSPTAVDNFPTFKFSADRKSGGFLPAAASNLFSSDFALRPSATNNEVVEDDVLTSSDDESGVQGMEVDIDSADPDTESSCPSTPGSGGVFSGRSSPESIGDGKISTTSGMWVEPMLCQHSMMLITPLPDPGGVPNLDMERTLSSWSLDDEEALAVAEAVDEMTQQRRRSLTS